MASIPEVVPPLPRAVDWRRAATIGDPFRWLGAGARDFLTRPETSLLYGLLVFSASALIVGGLFAAGLDYILFPALSAFVVFGPALAVGLYEKSRRIEAGEPVTATSMYAVRPRSGGQVLFVGVLLAGLSLLWMRSAVLLYALFFGLRPFPGIEGVVETILTTPAGWALLLVGVAVGGLFAAFAFAISAFSIPMLLSERTDAFTAMGTSMALVWNNLRVSMVWGALIVALATIGVATAFLGLIVVFPLLGHATWHAWRSMQA